MIRHVVFDFDGTLVDSVDSILEIGNELAGKYKIKSMSREEFMALSTLSMKDRFAKLEIPVYMMPKITLDVLSKYRRIAHALKIPLEIARILKELKNKGIKITIISSNSVGNIEKCLKANNIDFIDKVYSSKGDMDKSAVIMKFLTDSGASREEVIYVGDELRDITASRTACIKVIAVTWGYDSHEILKQGQPDYIASDPSDILGIIKTNE